MARQLFPAHPLAPHMPWHGRFHNCPHLPPPSYRATVPLHHHRPLPLHLCSPPRLVGHISTAGRSQISLAFHPQLLTFWSGTGGGQRGRAMASNVVSILVLAFLLLAAVAFPVSAGPRQQGKKGGYGGGGGNLQPWECSSKCAARCSQTQYHKACVTFCNKCCAKCLCVPPGFYGNKGACPCYNNWKTKEGGPKCP